MINLKELTLHIMVDRPKTFIDGNDLKNIINHLPQLKKFIFNIRSTICLDDEVRIRSNEEIQQTLINFKDNEIISCVDYFPKEIIGQCHIYSCPYTLESYNNITNNFPGGLFKCVREISLFDERPFEHEFFIQIAQSFPLMEKFTLTNRKAQQHRKYQKSKDNKKDFPIIEYSHLTEIELTDVHKDYLEQFLDNTKTSLSKTIKLHVDYKLLKKVTRNFTKERTRDNCAKVNDLNCYCPLQITDQFRIYFSLIEL
jgi:hypothetical protein